MKNWFAKNKWKVLLSVGATFLPTLIGLILWNQLPDTMNSHWGADGVADGTASKAFAVFGMPAILAAANLLCMVATGLDRGNRDQNEKLMGIIFWIMPLISLYIGFTIPAALSLYWLIQGAVGTVMDNLLTITLRKEYDAEDAIRLQKAMEEELAELEKERKRAERRARACPKDGGQAGRSEVPRAGRCRFDQESSPPPTENSRQD